MNLSKGYGGEAVVATGAGLGAESNSRPPEGQGTVISFIPVSSKEDTTNLSIGVARHAERVSGGSPRAATDLGLLAVRS